MSELLQFFILLPLGGFLLSLLVPRKKERILSGLALAVIGAQLLGTLAFVAYWAANQAPNLDVKQFVLYSSADFVFFIDYYFDATAAVFAVVGAVLTFLVAVFSRYYLHREEGFKRFFTTLLLFYLGYSLVIFAGNFETLFIGWEFLGISSFLLIAFYRDRYLPVKNGLKVISFYRLGDICLILAMWMCHHLWHKNITFMEWNEPGFVSAAYQNHYPSALFIALTILVAAAIKSAQLPFSSWLPRAMEGPTTSSAIFYGSLSVHIGVFLLLRTYPFWGQELALKAAVISIGFATSLVATGIARVQSSVKAQIAYASIVQIGLMFIEVALGFHTLALVHFAGNAFLRTYQLLVSPSVLGYLVHDMFFSFKPVETDHRDTQWNRFKHGFYVLGVKEWNLDFLMYRFLWSPFKWLGNQLGFLHQKWAYAVSFVVFVLGVVCIRTEGFLPAHWYPAATTTFAALGLLFVLKAFTERGDALRAWTMAFVSQCFMALAIALNGHFGLTQAVYYLGGSTVAAAVGYFCLYRVKAAGETMALDQYHGHSYELPTLAFVFLLSCLGLLGFPITPSFIGVDLLFTYIHANQFALIGLTALYFLFLELAVLRIYTRVFLGQHKKAYHPIAFKSS